MPSFGLGISYPGWVPYTSSNELAPFGSGEIIVPVEYAKTSKKRHNSPPSPLVRNLFHISTVHCSLMTVISRSLACCRPITTLPGKLGHPLLSTICQALCLHNQRNQTSDHLTHHSCHCHPQFIRRGDMVLFPDYHKPIRVRPT